MFYAGDEKNQIHMVGYQLSSQCMGRVQDVLLLPTRDAPELDYMKESSEKQYVSHVSYQVSAIMINVMQNSNIL